MYSDEIKTLLIKIAIMVLTSIATALHQNYGAADISAIATDLVDLGVLGYGIYRSTNMKLVPEASTAIHVPAGPLPVDSITPPNLAAKVVG